MSGYIGVQPVPQSTQTRQTFTATASQTSFATAGYQAGYLDVYLNGVKLVDGTDYTATNGSDVVLTTGAASGDILEIVAYSAFTVADQAFTGDFSVDTNTLYVDSTNNRVGVGTVTPSRKLTVSGSNNTTNFEVGDASVGASFNVYNNTTNNSVSLGTSGSAMSFAISGSDKMVIDSSGNLLVGKTSDDGGATQGAEVKGNGFVNFTKSNDNVLNLNRLSSDGNIAVFRKDGITVGSIGTGSGRIAVGNGDTFVTFAGDLDALYPASSSSTTPRDNAVNIGTSGTRFKDLYLSGGVYLGGTGAANLLDDYEEGTFTPVWVNVSGVSLVYARYLKIGNTVNIWVRFTATGGITANSSRFTGVPFSATTLSSGTWTRGTLEGGFIEQQIGDTCYFASAPSGYTGTFQANLVYSTQ
jgi:hypothetical protein